MKTMTEELENINRRAFKGTCTIENAKVIADITTNNSREHLFKVVKELFAFSKKALDFVQSSDVQPTLSGQDSQILEKIIKEQLTAVLPDLLKNAMSTLPPVAAVQVQPESVHKEKPLPTMHTLTLKKKPEEEEGDVQPITENEWHTVRKDLRGSLKSIPVQKASLADGTATLRFVTKDHLDKAEKALANKYPKYNVSPKSEDQKKLDPKLSISDIHPDVTTKDTLLEELLEDNECIRELNGAEKMKVVYFDSADRFAVIQVSAEIREAIRQNSDRVYLGLETHRVRDRIHVIQCYHCQEFGHISGSKYCKSKDSDATCFYCAGSHSSRDCRSKKDRKSEKIKCSNCAKSRGHAERSAATTHKASDNLCPFFVREKERIMSRTMGCTEHTKNLYRQRVQELKIKLGRR